MSPIPIESAVEMIVKKAGFLGRMRQDSVFAQNFVQPAGAGSRRAYDEERRQRPFFLGRGTHRIRRTLPSVRRFHMLLEHFGRPMGQSWDFDVLCLHAVGRFSVCSGESVVLSAVTGDGIWFPYTI